MFSIFKRKTKSPPVVVNVIDDDYVKDFCYQWSVKYPIDRWWRNKHKVAFNSPQHRSVSFIDMRIEFEEDMIFRKGRLENNYIPNKGEWLKEDALFDDDSELTEEQRLAKYKKEFEEMDLSQYND